jgi:hypothetical protein
LLAFLLAAYLVLLNRGVVFADGSAKERAALVKVAENGREKMVRLERQ